MSVCFLVLLQQLFQNSFKHENILDREEITDCGPFPHMTVTVVSSVLWWSLDIYIYIYSFTIQILLEVHRNVSEGHQFSSSAILRTVYICVTTKRLHPAVGNKQLKTIIVCSKGEICEIDSDWTFRIVWYMYASFIATESAEFSNGVLKLRDLTLHYVSHCTV
jgi:hypothetical protein